MPKGGGRKAFLKGVRHDSDDDDAQDNKPSVKNGNQPQKPAAPKPNKADAFLIDAPAPPPPAAAAAAAAPHPQGSDSDEGGVHSSETRGQMVQRHKRVSG